MARRPGGACPARLGLRGAAGLGYDVVLNALGSQRYSAVWWGSLSLRVLTYAVLAIGVVTTIVLQLRDWTATASGAGASRRGSCGTPCSRPAR